MIQLQLYVWELQIATYIRDLKVFKFMNVLYIYFIMYENKENDLFRES